MSINIKKYTKDQMAKMVEEAAERLESQKKENAELAEQLKSQTAKTIALRNDLMAKMHSNAVLTEKLDQMNGEAINKANEIANLKADLDSAKNSAQHLNDQGQQYWRAWQALKREVADLKNKLNDAEAALGRANTEASFYKSESRAARKEATDAQWAQIVEYRRADYAEAHPWRNLWAWVKRDAARHE
nr:MAG TPA: hypothetical protein [Caudoviricetes sp.]